MFCSRGISHRYDFEFLELQPDKANKLKEIVVFLFFNDKFGNKTNDVRINRCISFDGLLQSQAAQLKLKL